MNVTAFQVDSLSSLDARIMDTIKTSFTPSLAIIFSTVTHGFCELSQLLGRYDIGLIGGSTAGEFTNGEITEGNMAVMLLDIDKEQYHLHFEDATALTSKQSGKNIARFGLSHFSRPAYITLMTFAVNGDDMIEGIYEASAQEPTIFGGTCSDATLALSTKVFVGDKISENAVATLVVDSDKIEVNGLAVSGWEPVGTQHVITKAKGNIIYTINGEPALDYCQQFFGSHYDLKEEKDTISLSNAQYPFQLEREGNRTMRAPVGSNLKERSLIMAGSVRDGDVFHFSMASGFDMVDRNLERFAHFKSRTSNADALLMFSCKARHLSLGPAIQDEIRGVYELWEKPCTGLFTYAEISKHADGKTNYSNETCSLVTLGTIKSANE